MHGPVCVLCGYINEEQAESCTADHYTADDSSHKEICGACGGVIKEESHLYTYTTETAEDGVRIHKGTCSVCGHTMDGACVFDPDGICEICGQPCTHEYTVGQKVLMNPIISWSVNSAVILKKKSTKLANLQTVKNIAPLAVIP